MVSVVESDAEHLARARDRCAECDIGDEATTGCRRATVVERVELVVADQGSEWIGERRVTGELGEVEPGAVVLERGPLVDIQKSKHERPFPNSVGCVFHVGSMLVRWSRGHGDSVRSVRSVG